MCSCNKDILYLGFVLPKKLFEEISRIDQYPHYATNKFSLSLLSALKVGFENVYILSFPEVRNYPAVKKILFYSEHFNIEKNAGVVMGFINIILIKHVSRLCQLIKYGSLIIKKNKIKHIVMYGTHTPYMLFGIFAKYLFDVDLMIVLTDQHGVKVGSDAYLGEVLRWLDTKLMKYAIDKFDSYLCLSKAFVEKFKLRRYFVLQGIINKEYSELVEQRKKNHQTKNGDVFNVYYAGALNKNNGVDLLLLSLSYIDRSDISINFLGKGDLEELVVDMSKVDARVKYHGALSGDELVAELMRANLLINPRPIEDEYAIASFPSKLIDYMLTGIPILTTRLMSIPEEIGDCFYFIDGCEPKSIADAIGRILSLSDSERNRVGRLASEKASILYDDSVVGKKIYELICLK